MHSNNNSISKNSKNSSKKDENWKTPGKDKIHGYWIKNLTNLHERLAWQLQSVLKGNVPEWIVEGRTSLIRKNKNIDPKIVTNYRPIQRKNLAEKELIPWEQKGCKRKSRGTKDHLLVDKMIMRHARRKHRNLSMVRIDYKKAYDSVAFEKFRSDRSC